MNEELMGYIEGIDATLAPFGGSPGAWWPSRVEGDWPSGLIIIASGQGRARRLVSFAWLSRMPLRTNNAAGDIVFVDGSTPHTRDGHPAA